MKVRIGFVSNSSSSSYICDVCEDVFDDDGDMVTCQRGHTFCEHHLSKRLFSKEVIVAYISHLASINDDRKQELIQCVQSIDDDTFTTLRRTLDSDSENLYLRRINQIMDETNISIDIGDIHSELPPEFCPICNLDAIMSHNLIHYLMIMTGMPSRNAVSSLIKRRFDSYDKFVEYLRENSVKS